MEILGDVCIFCFPIVSSDFQLGVGSGSGFCRFPGLDSTEAERPSGESRLLLPLGDFSRGLLLEST
jgi:hypothetical protein